MEPAHAVESVQSHNDILEVLLATDLDLTILDRMHHGAAGWAAHIGRDELAERLRVEG